MTVLAIDPGTTESAYCFVDTNTLRPLRFGKIGNLDLRCLIVNHSFAEDDRAVIEMVQSYGMPVGRETFETCFWIGRFFERLNGKLFIPPERIYRKDEKLHICHDSKANDANIRKALIDRFADHDLRTGKGTKNNPDWFYGFKADVWQSYAVAITYIETTLKEELQ